MIKVINSANETLAVLQNVVSPIISEGLNREFTLDFSTVIDGDKSQLLIYTNKIEAENNYFNMVTLRKSRAQDGIFMDISCEHVSYDLLSANFTAGFTATGLFSAVATTLLSGTGFTVGTVQITASQTISVKESTNARQILAQLAVLYGGELEFDKYAINLLTRRGADRGVQFRYRKNISNASILVDGRKKTAGIPKIVYEVSPAELEFEQGYIEDGSFTNESYVLGDTVKLIDEDLGLNTSLRIVKESHDVNQRMLGNVEISNFVEDLSDTITTIQTTSVAKDNIYNGCSIGPENGFVAERSDGIAKTSMNATNGIEIALRNTITASYSAIFYVQIETATGTAKLFLSGNAEFTGIVRASQIIGGSITIGSGSNTFNANGTDGIWLGHSAFSTAPFSVSLSGSATAYDLTLRGGRFNVGTGTQSMQFNTTDGLFLGSTAALSAPFSVTMSGVATAHDLTARNFLKVGVTTASIGFGNAGFSFIGADTAFIEYQEVTPASNSDFRIIVPNGECTIANSLGLRLMDATESTFTSLRCLNADFYGEISVSGDITLNGSIYDPSGAHLSMTSNTLTYFSSSGAFTVLADLS